MHPICFRPPPLRPLCIKLTPFLKCYTTTNTSPPSPSTKAELRRAGDDPPPLARPLGLPYPPLPGQNNPPPRRTWTQLYQDLTTHSYERNMATRQKLSSELSKSYFRDFNRLSVRQKGKSFVAPRALFKRDKALFFPNLMGRTLVRGTSAMDTTKVMGGWVSLVGVFSGAWAERQVADWRLDEALGEIEEVAAGGGVRRVDINVEENWIKAWLVMMFLPSIRRKLADERWGRYFVVRRGLSEDIREVMGYSNSKVGYVYLLDDECRIRWAGSGSPGVGEREAMVKGVRRLAAELKEKAGNGGVGDTGKRMASAIG